MKKYNDIHEKIGMVVSAILLAVCLMFLSPIFSESADLKTVLKATQFGTTLGYKCQGQGHEAIHCAEQVVNWYNKGEKVPAEIDHQAMDTILYSLGYAYVCSERDVEYGYCLEKLQEFVVQEFKSHI